MNNQPLTRTNPAFPSLFDDFFRPWNEWFETGNLPARVHAVPAVNIVENKGDYTLSLAAPGLSKDDFRVDVDERMLTISCAKETGDVQPDARYTRREYRYQAFSRSFSLPENVSAEGIEARYENGELILLLPKKQAIPPENKLRQIAVQ